MDRRYSLAGFQFDNNDILYQQIDSIAKLEPHGFIDDRERNLRFYMQAAFAKFIKKAGFIGALKQPGPKRRVDCDCGVDDNSLIRFRLAESI